MFKKLRTDRSTENKGSLNITCLYPFDISYNLRLRPKLLEDLNLIFLNQAQSGGEGVEWSCTIVFVKGRNSK